MVQGGSFGSDFTPWPGNFDMLQVWSPKDKQTNKETKTKKKALLIITLIFKETGAINNS